MDDVEEQPLIPSTKPKHQWTILEYFTLAGSCVLLLLFGVMNNVGVSMQGYVMPGFAPWLLYGTTMLYTTGFLVLAFILKDNPFKKHHFTYINQMYYLKLGLLTAAGGVFVQFSIPWVDGDLAQILSNCSLLQIPIFEFILFKSRRNDYNLRQIVCLLIVFVGIVVGAADTLKNIGHPDSSSEQADNWYWVLSFFIATTFFAWQSAYQDLAYHDPKATITEVSSLFWLNLYSIPMYLIVIPFQAVPYMNGEESGSSFSQAFVDQDHAFRCFLDVPYSSDEHSEDGSPANCESGATLWPLIFSVGYVGLFTVSAFMINRYGMLFPNVVSANNALASSIVFTIPAIVGSSHAVPFSWWPIVGCFIIAVGIIGKGTPKVVANEPQQTSPESEPKLMEPIVN